jgi:hypothetical protein
MSASIQLQQSSVDAYHAQGHEGRQKQWQQILQVMRDGQRQHGTVNFTGTELTNALQASYPQVGWHPGKTAARVNAMVTQGLLVRSTVHRNCTVTGKPCLPVSVAPKQERLVS